MITKKLLTLGLTLTLMSPLASYAGMGAESGGGGDAVKIGDDVILRDLVLTSKVSKISDNLVFLNSIPNFRAMVFKLAKANPYFATQLIIELTKVTLYKSPSKLPLLPYSETTILGDAADVQLATRVNDEVIFGPEFFIHPQAEFILLHEALHGLLENNSGPVHHQRVRSIVKYVHDNLNNLDSEELGTVLTENNFRNHSSELHSLIWDKKSSESLKCYAYEGNRYYLGQSIKKFLDLKCIEGNESEETINLNRDKFISENYFEYKDIDLNSFIFVNDYVQTINLKKDSIFSKNQKKWQMSDCRRNNQDLVEMQKKLIEVNNNLQLSSKVEKIINDESVNLYAKLAIMDNGEFYINDSSNLKTMKSAISERIADLLEKASEANGAISKLSEQSLACAKQYPNL